MERAKWQISEAEKTAMLQRYLQIINNCNQSQLAMDYINAAKLVLRSLMGHWLGNNISYRQEYRDLGHHGFNAPIGDLLDQIMRHWEAIDVSGATPKAEPTLTTLKIS